MELCSDEVFKSSELLMLDFHLIHDNDSPENHSAERHNYVGGIDFSEVTFWNSIGILNEEFDYYSDFRLTSNEVVDMLNRVTVKKLEFDGSSNYELVKILNEAKLRCCGLMAYAD